MERIDRRVPIKVIAQELGVSETRVNQHIRALKDSFEAESLGDLVERYRSERGVAAPDELENARAVSGGPASETEPLSEDAYRKRQIPQGDVNGEEMLRVDRGKLVMSDVMPLIEQAPWLKPKEPKVVPGVLDGENAVLFRLATIVGIAFGCLAAVVLTVTAAVTISETLDGRATVPEEKQQGLS
jgi:hypothetical protein